MKIAGRKNAGAWYRFNKTVKNLSADEAGNLKDLFQALGSVANFYTALQDIVAKTGVKMPDKLSDVDTMITQWVTKGIPLQIWMGKLTVDTYTPSANGKLVADHTHAAQEVGEGVRKVAKRFMTMRRQLNDIENEKDDRDGNPSGVADATKNT